MRREQGRVEGGCVFERVEERLVWGGRWCILGASGGGKWGQSGSGRQQLHDAEAYPPRRQRTVTWLVCGLVASSKWQACKPCKAATNIRCSAALGRAPLTPGPHVVAEGQLANGPPLVVVPHDNLVGGVLGAAATAHEGQDVAAEQHLHDGDAAVGKLPAELQDEREVGGVDG